MQSHHDGDTPLHKVCAHFAGSRQPAASVSPPFAFVTVLGQAVREGHLDIVQLLLTQGADATVINVAGACAQQPVLNSSRFLVFHGADEPMI